MSDEPNVGDVAAAVLAARKAGTHVASALDSLGTWCDDVSAAVAARAEAAKAMLPAVHGLRRTLRDGEVHATEVTLLNLTQGLEVHDRDLHAVSQALKDLAESAARAIECVASARRSVDTHSAWIEGASKQLLAHHHAAIQVARAGGDTVIAWSEQLASSLRSLIDKEPSDFWAVALRWQGSPPAESVTGACDGFSRSVAAAAESAEALNATLRRTAES